MSEPQDPFEDPEVKAAMSKAGIVHRPGMAAEMMQELAPLLAAEGINLQDPDDDTDLETLNSALARATEQYNLGLFTPVGTHRDQVLTVLQEFTGAVSRKRGERDAEAVLDSIEPEATAQRPAASHVIGATLGLLDTWYTDAVLTESLGQVTIPKWRGPARSTARNLLAAARKGQAYASLDTLIMRHGGRFVMDSAVLAAAATILTYAQAHGMDVPQAAQALYEHTSTTTPAPSAPAPATGAAFGSRVAESSRHNELLAAFRSWSAGGEEPSPELQSQVSLLETLMDLASQEQLDPGDPEDTAVLADLVLDADNPRAVDAALQALHEYVHFQLDTSRDSAAWAPTHEHVVGGFEEAHPAPQLLTSAIEEADALPDSETRAALGSVRLVAAVPELLGWLGKSQPITAAGGLRRADIEPVAAMIGVSAVGVAKRPPEPRVDLQTPLDASAPLGPDTIYAQSTNDVPELAAWWAALHFADVTELTATRVRPGPCAADFTPAAPPARESAEILVSVFVAEILTQELDAPAFYFGKPVMMLTISRLMQALAPESYEAGDDESELTRLLDFRVSILMQYVEQAGLVKRDAGGLMVVPVPLRGAVAKGVLMAVEFMSSLAEDDAQE